MRDAGLGAAVRLPAHAHSPRTAGVPVEPCRHAAVPCASNPLCPIPQDNIKEDELLEYIDGVLQLPLYDRDTGRAHGAQALPPPPQ